MLKRKASISAFVGLNPAQRKAVESTEGPVMVIAGPGTGKTQTLTARIANILKATDTPPDAILALTFTDAASGEMRERLASLIGPTAYYVNIHTFHAFCSSLIQSNPDVFPGMGSLEALSDLERVSIFRSILDQGKFSHLRPHGAPYLYVRDLIDAIADLKREGVSPTKFQRLLEKEQPASKTGEKFHARNRELAAAYRAYQKALKDAGRYDFEDMIILVADAFKRDKEFLLSYQQRFLYVLVDEYQDTNAAQNELLMLLISYWKDQANLFVVGDDDQAIFRFQGASIENILSFHSSFSNAQLVVLTDNYRSDQFILDAARSVIGHNRLSLTNRIPGISKNLKSTSATIPEKISLGRFSSGATEQFFIAKKIQELIAKGTPPQEIAVIFRHRADGVSLSDMLARFEIPFDLESGEDVLTDPTVERILLTMRAVWGMRNNQEGVDLFTFLNYSFLGCDPLDVLKLSRAAADRKTTLWGALESLHDLNLKFANPAALKRVRTLLPELQRDDAEGPFVKFFEKLINKTGILDWCLRSADAVEKLNAINSLFAEVKRLNATNHDLRLEDFLDTVEVMKSQHVPIYEQDLDVRSESVALLTAHRAKGREFSVVFLTSAIDGKWGNNAVRELVKLPPGILTKTDISQKEKNEDERRLFYVAMTRVKKSLYITSARTYASSWGRRETAETMFVKEIPEAYLKHIDVSPYERGVKEILETFLTTPPRESPSVEEEEFLKSVLATFKLSPTALNTYLACPYKFKLNNLLRAPRAKAASFSYGSAIHKALETFFRQFKLTRKLPNISFLHQAFSQALASEILTGVEVARLQERGSKTLSEYVSFYKDSFIAPLEVERFFGYGFSKTILGSVSLGGKIDKIEPFDSVYSEPSRGTQAKPLKVRVIDYKTGQPKSRNDIEGKTSQSSGDYKRQLVFYRLLADLDEKFNAEVAEAELDFVEPDRQTGKFRKERFKITKEEVEELKQQIRDVWSKILSLKFPRTTEIQKHCPRCQWLLHCWPEGLPTGANGQLSLL